MKRLHGEASVGVPASAEECLALLAAVEGYPRWNPQVVRDAKVLATGPDGYPSSAEVTLHVSRPPIERDFSLTVDVRVTPPGRVVLTRVPHDAGDREEFSVAWEVGELHESRRIRLEVDACLAVPRFVPLGNIGDELAGEFAGAAGRALGAGA